MRHLRTYQSRLAAVQELKKRKILDNNIERAGNPTDCIRIREITNKEGDVDARIVPFADVISVVWPPMQDVHFSKLSCDGSGHYQITSLTSVFEEETNEKLFKIYFPHNVDVAEGDKIIRVFLDPDVKEPIILCIKVAKLMGTFGQLMLENMSANCTIDMQPMDDKTVQIIGEMARRRLHVGF